MGFNTGHEGKSVADPFGDVEADVGIIIGSQSVVKATLEDMEQDMMAEFAKDEEWRSELWCCIQLGITKPTRMCYLTQHLQPPPVRSPQ